MNTLIKNITVGTMSMGIMISAISAEITGAGATFPAPLYQKWAEQYQKNTQHRMNYQSIGSSGGIKQVIAKTVDFGASDKPLKDDELAKQGLIQFPTVIGGVVPVVNIPGINPDEMVLDGETIANIYLGKITKWNDPAILKLNPKLKLSDLDISVVRRADGSGTTFIFTDYLSKISAEWKEKVGADASVNWPVGTGGKGNEGVSAFVLRLNGAIGYVEYAYAKQNKMTYLKMINRDGAVVSPDDTTFKAAAAGADWDRSFYQILTHQPGKASWPISGATFILMHAQQEKPDQAKHVLMFFDWAFKEGGKMADELDYVPLPNTVHDKIRGVWRQIKSTDGGKVY